MSRISSCFALRLAATKRRAKSGARDSVLVKEKENFGPLADPMFVPLVAPPPCEVRTIHPPSNECRIVRHQAALKRSAAAEIECVVEDG